MLVTIPHAARIAAATVAILALVVGHAGAKGKGAAKRRPSEPVARLASGGETIPVVRTARGVTTMLSLPEEAREAVCGDLFDPSTGAGGFVVQRSGRDLFLKPLREAGTSNLFVKTERATYAFELVVVPQEEAMRIVYVRLASTEGARAGALEASFAGGLVTIGRRSYLRCALRNGGDAPLAVAEALVAPGGERVALDVSLEPGGSSTVVLAVDGPASAVEVRFFGLDGTELLAVRPFPR